MACIAYLNKFSAPNALEIFSAHGGHEIVRVDSDASLEQSFDIVISRAYSSLSQFVAQTRHLLGEQSKLLAMKGLYPQAEINDLPDDFKLLNAHELQIPGEAGARHLLELTKV